MRGIRSAELPIAHVNSSGSIAYMSDQKNSKQSEDRDRDPADIRERVQRLVKETSELNQSFNQVERDLAEAREEVRTFEDQA